MCRAHVVAEVRHPAAQEIVDFADERKPGWLRFGADLLGLAGTAQKKLATPCEN